MLLASPSAAAGQGSAARAEEPLLALRGVSKRFGATVALNAVSLDFERGQIHCVLGENGAGKSTIGKIIGGLHQPDEGRLFWDGHPIAFRNVKESRGCGVAMVFQELSLAPDLSVRANLRLGAAHAGGVFAPLQHGKEARDVRGILGRLDCRVDIEEPVKNLPVASQQMIEIAKALMQEPELIVLDEPTAMLGAVEKHKLFEVLRKLRSEGTSLVLITHHIDDVMALADCVSIMRNGQLVDSFAMDDHFDAESVLKRVTGGKLHHSAPSVSREPGREAVLRIENLARRDGPPLPMNIHAGEIVGLYGVVGCGAQAIVHALAGLGAGAPLSCVLQGRSFRPRSPAQAVARGVSYLPSGRASNGIFGSLSIRENLCLTMLGRFGRYGVVFEGPEKEESRRLLERFKVKYEDMEDRITSLSGGNQQKVLMARAMARARNVLLLEEPTAGIDVHAKANLHDCIRGLAAEDVAVVLLSCDLLETIQLCDTVYTFYEGQVVRCYETPTLADQPDIVADVLGTPSPQCSQSNAGG
jgi:ribose transport system ATP-binding protein